ncbi:MAG: hypothetical protein QM487_02845, partial [Candidatus Marithrix sp.]
MGGFSSKTDKSDCLVGRIITDADITFTQNGTNQLTLHCEDGSLLIGECNENISIEHEDFFYMNAENDQLGYFNVSYQLQLPLTIGSFNEEEEVINPFFGLFYKNLRYHKQNKN